MFDALWQDLRYAVRMLARSPGFAAVAVIALALGTGANTSIFSLLDAVMLRALPVREAEQLVQLQGLRPQGRVNWNFSYSAYRDYCEQNQVFSGLLAYSTIPLSLSGGSGVAERIHGQLVSGNFFEVLGVDAIRGRTFLPEEDQTPGTHPVAVISSGFWQRRFAGDPAIVGKTVTLNNLDFTIVGVTPSHFNGVVRGFKADLWLPMMMHARAMPDLPPDAFSRRGLSWLYIIGRLKPGVTLTQATAHVETLGRQLDHANNREVEERLTLTPGDKGATWLLHDFSTPLTMLMAVVGLVLLIACANVANLLLARASARRKEIAIRLALGAGRRRLVSQLLTESGLLALMGGAVGLLVATWANDFWLWLKPADLFLPVTVESRLDGRVLGSTLLLSLLTGMVFGLAPALQASKLDFMTALKASTATLPGGRRRFDLRHLLVIAQVALSLVLLVGAGLFARSLRRMQAVDVGFTPESVLVAALDLSLHGYDSSRGREFYRLLLERTRSLPGVKSATLAATVTPSPGGTRMEDRAEIGGRAGRTEIIEVELNNVGPGYFMTLNVPLLRGRDFTAQDRQGAPPVAVINGTMARRLFPNEDPIGKRIRFGRDGPYLEVIGVAGDGKYRSLREEPRMCLYEPFLMNYRHQMNLLVRAGGDPKSLLASVREAVQTLDPRIPVFQVRTLTEQVRSASGQERSVAALTSLFGGLALLLAAIGIYGALAFFVSQGTSEIGLRMALGAKHRDVLRWVMREGLIMTLIGISIGLAGALAAAQVLSSLLYGIRPTDPITFAGVSLLLLGVAALACFIPARRATRVDPMVALRYQ